MKKVITLVLLVVVVVVLVFVLSANKVEGVWKCSHYAININDTWKDEGEFYTSMFQMNIYDNNRVVLNVAGKKNEGTYILHKDTIEINIQDNLSKYVIEKDTLTLVDNPRARIKYYRAGKIGEK